MTKREREVLDEINRSWEALQSIREKEPTEEEIERSSREYRLEMREREREYWSSQF